MSKSYPHLAELPVYVLSSDTDAQTLSKQAQDLSLLLEEMGLYTPDGPAPAHAFHPARLKESE